jgi:N,N-dimethylformamidase beta subunit-like protein
VEKKMVWQSKRSGIIRFVLRGFCLSAVSGIGLFPVTVAAQSNPIVIENQQLGTSQWLIPWGSAANDAAGQVKGYASAPSVNKGETITFNISTNPAQTYTIDVYRMGWYQGLGGRLMQHVGPLAGVPQPTCPTDASTGMIECNWAPAYILDTQTSWTSGVYLALLTNAAGFENYIMFVVRDDSRVAPLLYQQPVTTYQAYNDYPSDGATGKSLYTFNSYGAKTVTGGLNAAKVSFDRPYLGDGTARDWGNSVMTWEIAFIRWMEQSGYDVTYSTDVDTHANGSRLLNYSGILSVGHDEYWSKPTYDAFVAARDAGVNLGFFGGDTADWQVRYEPSSSGVANRVVVCYRNATIDPITDPSLKTVEWQDPLLGRPAQTIVGIEYTNQVLWHPAYSGNYPYVVTNAGNWVYGGTGFKNGDSVPGIVGYEADRWFSVKYPQPNAVSGTYTLLSHSPFMSNGGSADYSNSSIYQAPSGAWVFGAGTHSWSWGLDSFDGYNTADPRIRQTTANILDRFANPKSDFTIAVSPASRTVTQGASTSYGVTISPTGALTGQVSLSVSGLPSGATASFTSNPATASSTLSVKTIATTPTGTYVLTVTGVNATVMHSTRVSLIVNPPDFTLSASPSSQTVLQGGSTSYGVTIGRTGGFAGLVSLSVTGLPAGANGTFTPNPATASSTLSVTMDTSTPTGTYPLTITGVSGTLTHTATVSLIVFIPDFSLSAPSGQAVQGGSTSYPVTISPTNGFIGQVSLSLTGLPSGASGSFTPNPATASSTLSITTDMSTPTGTYTLTITGASGILTHTITVSLAVVPVGVIYDNTVSSGIQWGVATVTTPPFGIGRGTNRAAMIMVTMSANGATNVTASLGGVSGTVIAGTDSGTTAAIRTMIFQVINPPSGSQTATVSWAGGTFNVDVGVITVSGADQTTPGTNGTFAANDSTPTAATSVAITSNAGDLTASVGYTNAAWVTPFTNHTLAWGVDSSATGGDIGPGTGTTTHTWTDSYVLQTHAVSGANFKAFATSFTLSSLPSSQKVLQGGSTSYGVTISPTGGFTGQVSLSVTGLPSGASGSFTSNPTTASSTLSVTTDATTPTGTYPLTITGVSGTLTQTTTVSLVVNAPDFTIVASPSSQTVTPGGSTNYGVTISPTNGFIGQVSLSLTGLPTGAAGSFTQNPATVSSTLSVTTDTTTPTGTYTLTITGASGILTRTTTVLLTVVPVGVIYDNKVSSGIQWGVATASTPPFVIGSGTNRAAMIMVTMSANGATNMTASLGGVSGTVISGTDSGTTATIRTMIFQVINPPSGSQTATVSWAGGTFNVDVGVITVSGADQTTPGTNGTFVANDSTPTATTSVTITSNPGDLTASVGYTNAAWVTPGTNQTLKWGVDSSATGGDIGPGTGTTTHTWTDPYIFQSHAVSGANFKAVTP